jgi:threonine dehydrogenase-like Zn-dependent dehydrogenase
MRDHKGGKRMKAVVWQGEKKVKVETVPDPSLKEETDIIIKVTSSGICGSDLHLYRVLSPLMEEGDIMGHEPMGEVVEVGRGVNNLKVGDRVVIPFNISCGHCFMCDHGLHSQCETTQVREYERGAALFGYTKMYGHVAGGQAQYLRVPQGHFGPIKIPHEGPDDQYLFLSDVLPTAWQAVEYAGVKEGSSVVIMGLGPIGIMSARIALLKGASLVIGVDEVEERLAFAKTSGVHVLNYKKLGNELKDAVLALTKGRGADCVIEAVGMEAHGMPSQTFIQKAAQKMPDIIAEPLMNTFGIDRMAAFHQSLDTVRRGGTISLIGVYSGMVDPLGVLNFATHHVPISKAEEYYKLFEKQEKGVIKVVLKPFGD